MIREIASEVWRNPRKPWNGVCVGCATTPSRSVAYRVVKAQRTLLLCRPGEAVELTFAWISRDRRLGEDSKVAGGVKGALIRIIWIGSVSQASRPLVALQLLRSAVGRLRCNRVCAAARS